ncbi:MAG: AAA family ATPase [Pyrinomonadaceae bacterium]
MSVLTKGYLRELRFERERVESFAEYPFSIPVVKNLDRLEFHPNVTFLVGENGTGKSTILEAIAYALRLNPEGGTRNSTFSTSETHSELFDYIHLIKNLLTPKDLYFLRAESFYNLASYMERDGRTEYLRGYGGKSLHAQSHGESFLSVLNHKLTGNGLYLFDEPEAALSPTRQLSALSLIHRLVNKNSQFIIATHSPIILAYPNCALYMLSANGIEKTNYQDTEHYTVTKEFLNRPEKMLSILFDEEE